ncbi:ribonuclease III [Coccomyxa subellipsoidea C-169]|uniref:Ribonuclease III n=1 Tax=Coccomyxa subellipsoidea (strain C-169) TaxID=574566 RepID=I0Z3L5_COCSC|nr:ribonuclease III [Coccomyxa subellipsoidea C-169]EIE25234.1 ribonuclease III [Coccomyxa subellipsoidea C-169]|eukprot:XP_005649778.1 ribonuclease III [Coccomyxa subellipsoidea C-169]
MIYRTVLERQWAVWFSECPVGRPRITRSRTLLNYRNTVNAAVKGFGPAAPTGLVDCNPVLPPVPNLEGKDVRANWNATALAFLGDSVWELYVRRHFFFPPGRLTTYYEGVTSQVRAETQETHYQLLLSGKFITEEEREILRWGRNAKVNVPPRFKASGKHAETYKHATAMECLAGYLYLTNPERLHALMDYLGLGGSSQQTNDNLLNTSAT